MDRAPAHELDHRAAPDGRLPCSTYRAYLDFLGSLHRADSAKPVVLPATSDATRHQLRATLRALELVTTDLHWSTSLHRVQRGTSTYEILCERYGREVLSAIEEGRTSDLHVQLHVTQAAAGRFTSFARGALREIGRTPVRSTPRKDLRTASSIQPTRTQSLPGNGVAARTRNAELYLEHLDRALERQDFVAAREIQVLLSSILDVAGPS